MIKPSNPPPNKGYVIVCNIIMAFIATFAVQKSLVPEMETKSGKRILWIAVFVGLYLLFSKACMIRDKRVQKWALGLACLFSVFFVVGQCVDNELSIRPLAASAVDFAFFLLSLLGFTFLFRAVLIIVINALYGYSFEGKKTKLDKKIEKYLGDDKKSFFIAALIMFICWLPQLASLFPGTVNYDGFRQLDIILGNAPLSNHHPVIHTALIAIFVKAGELMGNINIGIALYSIFQMLAMAAIFSYSLRYMAQIKISPLYRALCLLFFALMPAHGGFSVTMWKDVLFSGFILLLAIKFYKLMDDPENMFGSIKKYVSLIPLLFLVGTFRNNGLYIIILFIPVMFFVFRKYWNKILLVSLSALALIAIYKGPLFSALEVREGSSAEALSIPLQQLARTVKEHGDELTDEQKEMIDKYLPVDKMPGAYYARISDTVKQYFNDAYFKENKTDFIKIWLELFKEYPMTYIDAFLCGNYGYWYPDAVFTVFFSAPDENDVGVEHTPLPGALPVEVLDFLRFDAIINTPVISTIYSIGFYVWLIIICAAVLILKRRYKYLLPFAMLLLLWLTAVASPVFAEFRYIYGLVVCLPLVLGITLKTEKNGGTVSKHERKTASKK